MQNAAGLAFKTGIPVCPKWLSKEAKVEYARAAKLLKDAGVIQLVDLAYLATYAQSFADWRKLTEAINRDGTRFDGAHSGWIQNPDVRTRTTVFAQMSTAASKLGFSPTDRGRLARPEAPKEKSQAERFMED